MLLAGHRTGVEVSIFELSRALARRGECDVRLFVRDSADVPNLSGPRLSTFRVGLPGAGRVRRILWEQLRLGAIVNEGPYDLLHAPGYVAPMWVKKPVVLTVHDLFALTCPQWCARLNRWHYGMLLPASIRRAAHIIVPSQATRQALRAIVPRLRVNVSVIPFGVRPDLHRVHEAAALEGVRKRYALPDQYILYVGNLEPRKNVVGMLQAYSAYRDAHRGEYRLVLVGRQRFGARAGRLATLLGLRESVHLPGYIADDDLAAVYSMASVLFFPSLEEGFGFPVLEAMACGVPVITSRRGSIPEVAGDDVVFVDPADVHDMARTLARVLGDSDLRENLSARGLKRAARYTWENAACLTEQVYREC
ncbi:MAG: glycosyltransferase family 1 protein [Isosphaeraceae bacterium]|nr:glycosyltransferase family 1 protein [Isosphaeraceae bacterium]